MAVRKAARVGAAIVCAVVVGSAFVGPAEGAWSAQYAVTVASVGNVTSLGVWGGPGGRVAVTWTTTGQGPPTMWVREYVPEDGWYPAAEIGRNTFVFPKVHAAAFGAANVLYIAHDSADATPAMRVSKYTIDGGVAVSANLGQPPDMGVSGAKMATDREGSITLVWSTVGDFSDALYAARLQGGASAWSPINQFQNVSRSLRSFDLAVESGGRARVAWVQDGIISSELWTAASEQGTQWLPATVLATVAELSSIDEVAVTYHTALGSSVVWVHRRAANDFALRASSFRGGAWSTPHDITTATVVNHMRTASPVGGAEIVVWAQTMGGGLITCRSAGDGTGNWTDPEALHESAGASHEPVVASGPSAAARSAWVAVSGSGYTVWSRAAGPAWGTPSVVGQGPGVQVDSVRVAVDDRGVGWVGWTEVTSSSAQVVVRAEGLPAGEDVARTTAAAPPSSSGAVLLAVGILAVAAVAAVWMLRRSK